MVEEPEKIKAPGNPIYWLPNLLTYVRIIAVPFLAGLIMYGTAGAHWIALGIYIVASISDFFDGYFARIWNMQSAWGRMLDPIADKVLVSVVLLALAADGVLSGGHLWAAFIITAREVLVSGLREYLIELRVSVPVSWIAKWKTTAQLVAIGFLIAAPALVIVPAVKTIGLVLLWVAAVLTIYTGYDYFRAGVRHMVEKE